MAEKNVQTGAGEFVLPVEFVTLSMRALRRKDKAPVVVGCEFVSEDRFLAIIEALPGYSPTLGFKQEGDTVSQSRALLKYAPALVGASCYLVGPDGAEQRPAFHWGEDPKNGSLPGRFVSDADLLVLLVTILKVSGFVGGPADDLRFPDGERAGSERGAGTVDAGEGNGDEAGGVTAWEGEGGRAPADAGARG